MKLPFWLRKSFIFTELVLYILIGIFLGQALEVMGVVRWLAVLAWPFLRLGRLPDASGPPFIFAFQSGAVANSMLVAERDSNNLSNRQLYASVLVVSCLSLFAHLPTFIAPLGMALGWQATLAFFSVRFCAIAAEIFFILLLSRFLCPASNNTEAPHDSPTEHCPDTAKPDQPGVAQDLNTESKLQEKWYHNFFSKVWKRSRRTAKRLLIYVVPSFFFMTLLEYYDFFNWLKNHLPQISSFGFLNPEVTSKATAIIAAQAVTLNNGAAVAGSVVSDGTITGLQAAAILLLGSLITSPIRTLKHALPTYLSILGPKTGVALAITAQVLRILFTGTATLILIHFFI